MTPKYPKALTAVIRSLSHLPGIGKRTAERLAFDMMTWQDKDMQRLSQQISELHESINECPQCHAWCETEICDICSDSRRDESLICIVEDIHQMYNIEKSGSYRGLYHILGGKISPLNRRSADDLNITTLINRCSQAQTSEVIIALSPDVEGEATSHYLTELLETENIDISRIALGVPLGADLSYVDPASMAMSINKRIKL